jgi:hypothetical protein
MPLTAKIESVKVIYSDVWIEASGNCKFAFVLIF